MWDLCSCLHVQQPSVREILDTVRDSVVCTTSQCFATPEDLVYVATPISSISFAKLLTVACAAAAAVWFAGVRSNAK